MERISRSFSSEWRKVTATKTWWLLAIVMLLFSAMMGATFAFIYAEVNEHTGQVAGPVAWSVYASTATFGYMIPLVLGALAATNELRHHTLTVTFGIEPRRGIVLAGKALAMLVVGLVLAVAGLIGSVGTGAVILQWKGVPTLLAEVGTWAVFGRIAIAIALWALIGFGMGLIVKNQAFAIVVAIAFPQFIEPIARMGAQFWQWTASLAKFLPGSATDAFVGASVYNEMSMTDPSLPDMQASLGVPGGFLVLLAYVVVLCAIGWLIRLRADVN